MILKTLGPTGQFNGILSMMLIPSEYNYLVQNAEEIR